MAAPLPMTGVASDDTAWHELEDVFARLAQLARSDVAPEVFYRQLLGECAGALGATAGVVWLRAANGAMQPSVPLNWSTSDIAGDDDRRDHESLLAASATSGKVAIATAKSGATRLLAPVSTGGPVDGSSPEPCSPGDRIVAIVELTLAADLSPTNRRGYEEFMTVACEIGADFHAQEELRRLRRDRGSYAGFLEFAHNVHRSLNLTETAFTVANEGRRLIGCDRLSVLGTKRGRCRLLATSAVSRFERRSTAARQLERLAELVRRTDQPASYLDGQSDALSPVAVLLEAHAEQSHARQIGAVPLRRAKVAADRDDGDYSTTNDRAKRVEETPRFILVAEQFDVRNRDLSLERVAEAGEICSTALYNALDVDELPFAWVLWPLRGAKRFLRDHVARSTAILLVIIATIAIVLLVPADFAVEAPGTLQPVLRRDVFAPRSGLVDAVLVTAGEVVDAGQALVRLRDPQLDLELNRIHGEIETAERQLDAVRATRTNRAARDAGAVESYRLSAEQRELDQHLANLRAERELLQREREALVVASPIAGKVLTWDVVNRLIARPVERGEVLVTVADPMGDWQLELDVPDGQIGHVLTAQSALRPDLPVEFRLSSDDRELHKGCVEEICLTANVVAEPNRTSAPKVLVRVALSDEQTDEMRHSDLRSGISARARIACGQRSLAYVWLHDIWDALLGWLRF